MTYSAAPDVPSQRAGLHSECAHFLSVFVRCVVADARTARIAHAMLAPALQRTHA
jgi:hypothetical protein